MTPFAVTNGDILPSHLSTFNLMRRMVEQLDDHTIADTISCHHLCHALSRVLGVEVVDGTFGRHSGHSWIVLERHTFETHGDRDMVIADMYPWGGASPLLVYAHFMLPWKHMYRQDREFVADVLDDPKFQDEVNAIVQEFERMLPVLRAA